jgi:hypothetical protein
MTYTDIVRYYGTASEASRKLGLTRAAVSVWRRRGVPYGRQAQIQLATRGKLKASLPPRGIRHG